MSKFTFKILALGYCSALIIACQSSPSAAPEPVEEKTGHQEMASHPTSPPQKETTPETAKLKVAPVAQPEALPKAAGTPAPAGSGEEGSAGNIPQTGGPSKSQTATKQASQDKSNSTTGHPQSAGASAMPPKGPKASAKSRSSFSGCLKNPDAANRSAKVASRGPNSEDREGVRVVYRKDNQMEVRHNITHNCCHKATVKTKIIGSTINITETFKGESCRCNCSSSITTLVPLAKGEYNLIITVNTNGDPKSVHSKKVTL